MKIKFEFSPNFSRKIRSRMQSEIASIKRLKNPNSKVSCHYLINRNGLIIQMVKDKNIAWHAGKSKWKSFRNLNNKSIGIELVNKGHKFGYQNFSSKQIKSLVELCKKLKKRYLIKKENFLGHSDIAPLRKSDPGEKFPWKKLSFYKLGIWHKEKKQSSKEQLKIDKTTFFKNLHKLGYRYFNIRSRKSKDEKIIKSFQQHFLPENVNGKIDKKTFKICHFLTH